MWSSFTFALCHMTANSMWFDRSTTYLKHGSELHACVYHSTAFAEFIELLFNRSSVQPERTLVNIDSLWSWLKWQHLGHYDFDCFNQSGKRKSQCDATFAAGIKTIFQHKAEAPFHKHNTKRRAFWDNGDGELKSQWKGSSLTSVVMQCFSKT